MNVGLFDSIPIAGVYLLVVMFMLGFCEAGYFIGKRITLKSDKNASTSLGPMVGGLLGMLAFVLAITFSMAASFHDLRKQTVLNEANAIGTAYLRADLLDTNSGNEVKKLLREYVDIRLGAARGDLAAVKVAIKRSTDIHQLLWDVVSTAAKKAPSVNTSLMVQSLNEVIDMHEKRLNAALRSRIPGSIWISLIIISVFTMITLGSHTGLTSKRGLIAVVPLSLAFAALLVIVVELDRPQRGLITVNQQAMINLQSSMAPGTK